jgi:hypothetical protein
MKGYSDASTLKLELKEADVVRALRSIEKTCHGRKLIYSTRRECSICKNRDTSMRKCRSCDWTLCDDCLYVKEGTLGTIFIGKEHSDKCNCSENRGLLQFPTSDDGYYCDICTTPDHQKNLPKGTNMHGCRECGTDICDDCWYDKVIWESLEETGIKHKVSSRKIYICALKCLGCYEYCTRAL